jgi:hypothetical protein
MQRFSANILCVFIIELKATAFLSDAANLTGFPSNSAPGKDGVTLLI